MASTLKVTVVVELDGHEHLRLTRRLSVGDVQTFNYDKASGGGYVALPTSELAAISALVVEASEQPVTLRFDGQTNAGVFLNPGGFVVVVDGNMDDGVATNATINNSSGSSTPVRGLVGGA